MSALTLNVSDIRYRQALTQTEGANGSRRLIAQGKGVSVARIILADTTGGSEKVERKDSLPPVTSGRATSRFDTLSTREYSWCGVHEPLTLHVKHFISQGTIRELRWSGARLGLLCREGIRSQECPP